MENTRNAAAENQIAALMLADCTESGGGFGSPNIHALLSGISAYADEHHLEAAAYLMKNDSTSYTDYCRRRNLENVIIFGANYDSENFRELADSLLNCVAIDIPIDACGETKGAVLIDDRHFAKIATERLIAGGCKHIAMLSGHAHAYVSQVREAGYREALEKAGLAFSWVADAGFEDNLAADVTRSLLENHPEIDGFFCAGDYMALGCHGALTQMGVAIPDRVSLFGFDGNVSTQMVYPPISAIKQDSYRKGYFAAELLHRIIQTGGQCVRRVVVPCSIIEGGTVKNGEEA